MWGRRCEIFANSPFLNLIEKSFSVFKLKLREVLQKDAIINRIVDIPVEISAAEQRLQILQSEGTKILEDMETISCAKVTKTCGHIMTNDLHASVFHTN